MADRIRLSSIEGGGNWWITLNWAAQAFRNAARVMVETGCDAVKLEGGVEMAPTVEVRPARRAIAAQPTEPAPVAAAATAEPEDASEERWQSAFDAEPDDETRSKPG